MTFWINQKVDLEAILLSKRDTSLTLVVTKLNIWYTGSFLVEYLQKDYNFN